METLIKDGKLFETCEVFKDFCEKAGELKTNC
jgi:hypothetical protein